MNRTGTLATAGTGTSVIDLRTTTPAGATAPGRGGRLIRSLSTVLVVLAVVVFALLAAGPHLFGYRTATMLTGSMAPTISPGDVVVTVPRPATDVAVGDVLSYHIPVGDNRVVTHRVIDVQSSGDRVTVSTQGDANPSPDPWTATLEGDTVHQAVVVVPRVGEVIRALRADPVQLVLVRILPVALVGFALVRIWRRPSVAAGPGAAPADPADGGADEVAAVPALDPQVIARLREDMVSDAAVGRFLARYLDLLPERVERVRAAVAAQDLDEAMDATLSLGATSSMAGATRLAQSTSAVRTALAEPDLSGATVAVQHLVADAAGLRDALLLHLAEA